MKLFERLPHIHEAPPTALPTWGYPLVTWNTHPFYGDPLKSDVKRRTLLSRLSLANSLEFRKQFTHLVSLFLSISVFMSIALGIWKMFFEILRAMVKSATSFDSPLHFVWSRHLFHVLNLSNFKLRILFLGLVIFRFLVF